MSDQPLTLRLVINGERHVVSIPPSATVAELYERALQLAKKPKLKTSDLTLLTGFPPQPVECSSAITLHEAGIQSQQTITVNFRSASAAAAASPASAAIPVRATSQKRAAAQKAAASFKDVIAQQDQLQTSLKPAKKNHTSSPNKKPRFTAASTTGYRLSDGAVVAAPAHRRSSHTGARAKPRSAAPPGGDFVASAAAVLVPAATGSRSRQARLVRAGWKQAINDAYEQNKAVARLAAIAADRFTFSLVNEPKGTTGPESLGQKTLQVAFDKGVQGRGEYTEAVDYLPKSVLSSALASIHASHTEALRPENMALLSPRVLWSLMYHYNRDKDDSATPSVAAAMKQLQPDLDWSFLRRRKEQLSAKARENLRQEQEASDLMAKNKGGSELDEWTRAAEAIAAVERAMENMEIINQSTLLTSPIVLMEPWFVETPSELDIEELETCVATSSPEHLVKEWVTHLHERCGIRNWRELANANTEDISEVFKLDNEICQAWIDHAQTESVDEIIVDICGGCIEAVDLLREGANSGTPSDLAGWRPAVSMLHELLEDYCRTELSLVPPSMEDLQTWCNRAYQACEQLEWLQLFATDVCANYGAKANIDEQN